MLWLAIYLAACFTQAHGQGHDFSWAMECEDMLGLILSFFAEEDWKTHNQLRQINQHMRDLFRRETGIAEERWQELETLHDHFGRLRRPGALAHRTWFRSSNPCEWSSNSCDQQGRLRMSVSVYEPDDLQASTPVTHALENVVELRIIFRDAYPQLDLDYIARLFPNLGKLTITANGFIQSFSNLQSLSKMPLEILRFETMNMPLELAEWLADMTHLYNLHLGWLTLRDPPTLDLRLCIPPSLERFSIILPLDYPSYYSVRVLLSDDVILAREQEDGSVLHQLDLDFQPARNFPDVEIECSTLNPLECHAGDPVREITLRQQAPNIRWRRA